MRPSENVRPGEIPARDSGLEWPKKYSIRQGGGKKIWLAWTLLIVSLVLTGVLAFSVKNGVDSLVRREFSSACNEIEKRISVRLQQHAQILRGGSSLFEVTGNITREQWRSAITHQNIDQNHPGIQGIGFAVLIHPADLARHERDIQRNGFPDYKVKPAGKRKIFTSIIYLEPFSGRNLRAFGFDMFSEPIRRKAMEYARDFDEAALSGKITLVQETGQDVQAGTLMYVPVYDKHLPIRTMQERRRAIRGWVYSPYRMKDLLSGILGAWEHSEGRWMRLEIFDGATFRPDALLYDSSPLTVADTASGSSASEQTSIAFNGHVWSLRFTRDGGFASGTDYSKVWFVLIGGAAVSGLLFALYLLLLHTRSRAQSMAEELTRELRESEEKYRIIFNNEIYAICIFDIESLTLLDVNDAYCRMYGYSREEILSGKTIHEITAEHQASESATTEAQHKGTIFIPLRFHKKKDGSVFPVEIVGGPHSWKGRKVMFALAHDITMRKRTEEALLRGKQQYDNLVSNIPVGIYLLHSTPQNTFTFDYVSPRMAEMIGVGADVILRDPQAAFLPIHPEEIDGFIQKNKERISKGQPFAWEGRFVVKGIVKCMRIESSPEVLQNGDMLWHGVVADITERKEVEKALRESERFAHETINALSGSLAVIDAEGTVVATNRAWWEFSGDGSGANVNGIGSNYLKACDTADGVGAEEASAFAAGIRAILRGDQNAFSLEYPCQTPTELLWFNGTVTRFTGEGPVYLTIVHENITERRRAGDALRKSEIRFRSLFENHNSVMLLVDPLIGKIVDANVSAVNFYGYTKEHLCGLNVRDLNMLPPEEVERERQRAVQQKQNRFIFSHRLATGEIRTVEVHSSPIEVEGERLLFSIVHDISDRTKAEDRLRQTRQNYEAFFNTIDEFLFVLDQSGNIMYTNSTVRDRLQYTQEELFGKSVLTVHPVERRDEAGRIVGEMLRGEAEYCPVPLQTKDGIQIPVETRVKQGIWNDQPVIFGVTKDISRITLSEEKFKKIFYLNPSACGLSDMDDHKYVEVNDAFHSLLGFDRGEVIGRTPGELGIISAATAAAMLKNADANGRIVHAEAELRSKNGDVKRVLMSAENILVQDKKYRFTIVNDITERKLAEEKVAGLLREKELLLKEVHHRIKNNMNTVMALLTLQADTVNDQHVSPALRDAASRLQSMGVLYDRLYRSSGFHDISVREYLLPLVDDIVQNFPNSGIVTVDKQIEDFTLDVNRSSPMGIIVNELLTNCMKHAFVGRERGRLGVSASMRGNRATFSVHDDGVGVPASVDFGSSRGFGLQLVHLLTEQLEGTIRIERGNGTRFVLEFGI